VLTLLADGAESLWDEILPAEVKALPDDLAKLDELLSDSALLAPIAVRWERELTEAARFAPCGRPSIAMESYVRLMVIKHRCGWGYETLMREVSAQTRSTCGGSAGLGSHSGCRTSPRSASSRAGWGPRWCTSSRGW
jgi:hypothetical protein